MLRLIAIVPVLAVLGLAPSAAVAEAPTLTGVVGTADGFTISLRDAAGNGVTHLDPGTYAIQISDRSDFHNFHLSGPGVNEATPIEGTADVTWMVTFQDGHYSYICDAHPSSMRGTFAVGNVSAKTERGELEAQVRPGRIVVTRRGERVRTVSPGAYRIVVHDRTRHDDFHLTGPGVNRRTGVAFTGTARWSLKLRARSTYRYRSDAHARLRGTFRTSG